MKNLYMMLTLFLLITCASEAEWKQVYQHSKPVFQWDIDCADSLNCISAASPGQIGTMFIKTTDGGYSWFIPFADTSKIIYNDKGEWVDTEWPIFQGLRCIDYVTPEFAVAGHKEGQITITRDGGVTWDSTNFNAGSQDIKDIQFINENYGVVRTAWYYLKTYNGGEDWEFINLKYKEELNTSEYEMNVIGEDSIIVVVLDRTDPEDIFYRIARTFDGGETWDIGAKPPLKFKMKPFFIDMELGWVAGRIQVDNVIYSDAICKTTDGGHTWEKQLDTLNEQKNGLTQLHFKNRNVGMAYGEWQVYWKTNNGGEDWIRYDSPDMGNLDAFAKLAFSNVNEPKIIGVAKSIGEIWMYEDLTSVVETKNETIDGLLYPNPASEYLNIMRTYATKTLEETTFSIYNTLGVAMIAPNGDAAEIHGNYMRVSVAHLLPGVYFIRVAGMMQKFIKI